MEPNNNKYKKIVCPLCQSNDSAELYVLNKRGYDLYIKKCQSCELVYQNPRLDDVKTLYQDDYFEGKTDFSYTIDENVFLPIWESRLEFLQRCMDLPSNARLLDIGCAKGSLLLAARNLGWECWGMDISEYATQTVKHRIPEAHVISGELAEAGLPRDFFHVITMFEVIEHLTNPVEDLKAVNNSLRDDGVLVIQTANFASLTSWFKGRNYYYFEPGHLIYFTAKTLKLALEKSGFEVKCFWAGSELPVFSELKVFCQLISPLRLTVKKVFNKLNIAGWTMNSVMVVYCRKKSTVNL